MCHYAFLAFRKVILEYKDKKHKYFTQYQFYMIVIVYETLQIDSKVQKASVSPSLTAIC